MSKGRARRTIRAVIVGLALALIMAYVVYPWFCRRGVSETEASAPLPGDDIVVNPTSGYTLAVTIAAPPSRVWPWLVQMGQGRAGFYTHQWIENLLGADINNADRIIPDLQQLAIGDRIRLIPDPFLGNPGQFITVAALESSKVLVFRQSLPSGGVGSWAYILQQAPNETTRLVFRRRGSRPSLFDRVMGPGYYLMDRGMLAGIKKRVEAGQER